MLVDRISEASLLNVLFAGARGYLKRTAVQRFLPRAVRLVDAGEAWVARRLVSRITDQLVSLRARKMGGGIRSTTLVLAT
jgi:DNA-binding NarL/FixJ family response regulator